VRRQGLQVEDQNRKLKQENAALTAAVDRLRGGTSGQQRKATSHGHSFLDPNSFVFKELIEPIIAFFGVIAAITLILLMVIAMVSRPIRFGREDEEHVFEGCCAKLCRAYFRLHWYTHCMGVLLLGAALVGWIFMWWEGIVQPYLSEFGMAVYLGFVILSLILLLVMELTMVCRDHARRVMEKVHQMEEALKEKLKKARGKVDGVLDNLYLTSASDSEEEDEAPSGSRREGDETHGTAASSSRDPKKRKRRQPACC